MGDCTLSTQEAAPPRVRTRAGGQKLPLVVLLVALALTVIASVWLRVQARASNDLIHTIEDTFFELEDAIGYTGAIHHFKNAVLRPDEPRYLDWARRDFDRADRAVTQLRDIVNRHAMDVELSHMAGTLGQYRAFLPLIAEGHAKGLSVAEIDALVRVPDDAADIAVDRLRAAMLARVSETGDSYLRLQLVSYVALAILLGGIASQFQQTHRREQALQLAAERDRRTLLERHRAELKNALSRMDRSHKEMAEFTYSLSHDLKSPAHTARMLVAALRQDFKDVDRDAAEADLEDLDRVLVRMLDIIGEVLTYSGSLFTELDVEPVPLGEVVATLLDDLRSEIADAGALVRVGDLPLVHGNRRQLHRLFANLIGNSLKYRRPDVPLTIDIGPISAGGSDAVIEVRDNGIGIAPQNRERVFGLFSRLHTQESISGVGLGLPICRRIALSHGGDITITDGDEGVGTTFTLRLVRAGLAR